MKKKTNKILLIAALVVVFLNLAIIGTGLALAARNADTSDTNRTMNFDFDIIDNEDGNSECITITADDEGDGVNVVTVYCDEDDEGEE